VANVDYCSAKMKLILLLLAVFLLAGCSVRHTAVENGSAKIADSKMMVAVQYHTGPATITVELKDDEHDLRLLRPIPSSVSLVSHDGIQYLLDYDPQSVRFNGCSKYSERYGVRVWMSFDFAHPRISGSAEIQDLPTGNYTMFMSFSGVPAVPDAKIEFSLVGKDTKINWAFK
jgi:hypothetical protein